jgi:hypothetical protein
MPTGARSRCSVLVAQAMSWRMSPGQCDKPPAEIERWCEIIAAIMSAPPITVRILQLGLSMASRRLWLAEADARCLTTSRLGYDQDRMMRQLRQCGSKRSSRTRPGTSTMSPFDLKQLPTPSWIENPDRSGAPTLMLCSVDRSGVAYQEYRCVGGRRCRCGSPLPVRRNGAQDRRGRSARGCKLARSPDTLGELSATVSKCVVPSWKP